jgi:hypothetical protein
MRRILVATLLATATFALPGRAAGQATSACLQPDSVITFIQGEIVNLVTATDTAATRVRAALNVPAVAASAVELVADSTTCARAASALAEITTGGEASQGAWVFRLGPTRFIAFNFRQKARGSVYLVVYDENFVRVSSFAI